MKKYRIKNWDQHFENNKSRERDACSWCAIPNKQDGLGYGRLLRRKNGAALYGAFVAVVLSASKQKRPRDGHLTDTGRADGCPYSADDLSVKTQVPVSIISEMLDVVSDASIGWIETYDDSALEVPAECPPSALEGKGREEKEEKGNGVVDPACSENQDFDSFWSAYPRKKAKADARKAWSKAKNRPPIESILSSLAIQVKSTDWTKENGKYVPYPATWINGARWEDEPMTNDLYANVPGCEP